jgi:hypothetical protein
MQFAAAVFAGIAWMRITMGSPRIRQIVYAVIAIFIIIIEYRISATGPYHFDSRITAFYSWLNNQTRVSVILELPIGNHLPVYPQYNREVGLDSKYLLYAELHTKKLVNGLSSFEIPEAQRLGDILTIRFPTADKLAILKSMGVNLIVIHLEEYTDREAGEQVISGLKELGVPEIYNSEPIHAFLIL